MADDPIPPRLAPLVTDLCAPLAQLLHAELAAGNALVDGGRGQFTPDGIFLLLARPFRVARAPLPDGVVRVAIDDPHWWLAEYRHAATGHVLACRF